MWLHHRSWEASAYRLTTAWRSCWHEISKTLCLRTISNLELDAGCTVHWRWLSCFSHNLDLAVQIGLTDGRVKWVLRVCRQIVSSFSYGWKRRRELAKEQEKRNLSKHILKPDMKTPWGSVFDVTHHIMGQQKSIRIILAINSTSCAHLARYGVSSGCSIYPLYMDSYACW